MPTPTDNESRDDFIARCVPMVMDDGAAEDQNQAVAMCGSMYDDHDKETRETASGGESKHASFVKCLATVHRPVQEFGYGITTAEPYAKAVLLLEETGAKCGRTCSPDQLLKEASQRLCYATPGMVAEKIAGSAEGLGFKQNDLIVPPNALMVIQHILTTDREDRDGDMLEPAGAEIDPKSPLLWQHQPFMPVGKLLKVVEQNAKFIRAVSVLLDLKGNSELTSDIARLIEADALRFSHGFMVTDYEARKNDDGDETGGFHVTKWKMIEESLVSVPSNVGAVIELFTRGKLESDLFKAQAKHFADNRRLQVTGANLFNIKRIPPFNRKGISEFHPEHQQGYASWAQHGWAAKWLSVDVKDLRLSETYVPRYAMGNFLSAIKQMMADWTLRDTRKIDTERFHEGLELPVKREMVQLNSQQSELFIVDGFQFWSNSAQRCCTELTGSSRGMDVHRYDADDRGAEFFERCWEWVRENNFMRGEAFRLSGQFIQRGKQPLEGIFLTNANKDAVARAVALVNAKSDFASRGMILMGPPGTGKTLSARAILANTKATFIWGSAKDISGSGDIKSAYTLARELSPCVLCFEDIDSCCSDYAFDILKAELDGLDQHDGILTLLTTNYPHLLPNSLIDRPGRFHDVLKFGLPTECCRKQMLDAWIPASSQRCREQTAKSTDGFSGAHIKDLCTFADVLHSDDSLPIDEALEKAFGKISEQRRLVRELNSTCRGRRTVDGMKRFWSDVKAGRVLSGKNMEMLQEALDDMHELMDMDMSRSGKALVERCIGKLETVLKAAKPIEEEDGKTGKVFANVQFDHDDLTEIVKDAVEPQTELIDVVGFVLGASQDDLACVKHTIDMVVNLEAYSAAGDDYRFFTKSLD